MSEEIVISVIGFLFLLTGEEVMMYLSVRQAQLKGTMESPLYPVFKLWVQPEYRWYCVAIRVLGVIAYLASIMLFYHGMVSYLEDPLLRVTVKILVITYWVARMEYLRMEKHSVYKSEGVVLIAVLATPLSWYMVFFL